jgi:hypothetical protein
MTLGEEYDILNDYEEVVEEEEEETEDLEDSEDVNNLDTFRDKRCFSSNCCNCKVSMPKFCEPTQERKKNDQQMKDFIHEMLFEDMRLLECGCKEFQGKCTGMVKIAHVGELRDAFWGSRFDEAVKTKDKGKRLDTLLRTFYDAPNDNFRYRVGDTNVCERGFFLLLGLLNKSNKRIGRQLRRVMNTIRNKILPMPEANEESRQLKKAKDPRTRCSRHAVRL